MSNMQIQGVEKLMSMINNYPQYGTIAVIDPTDPSSGNDFDHAAPGDIVIHPDFWDDECPDAATVNQLASWYNDALHGIIDQVMQSIGYELIAELDGSGGGLYYCTMHYRPSQNQPLRLVK